MNRHIHQKFLNPLRVLPFMGGGWGNIQLPSLPNDTRKKILSDGDVIHSL